MTEILLVEDSRVDALLLKTSLERRGDVSVTHVARLDEALQQLRDRRFDVVLLDLGLPDSEGLDTVLRMLASQPDVPIVVVSALEDEDLAIQVMQAGAQDFLVKGLMLERVLVRSIRYALERRRTQAVEAQYRDIFENAVEGFFQTTPEGQFISANPALLRMYGYQSLAELQTVVTDIGRQLYVDPTLRERFGRTMENLHIVSGFEAQMRTRDGRTIWVSESVRTVRDEHGKLLRYEGTVEDITARKQSEAEALAANDMLRAIELAQSQFIASADPVEVFDGMLNSLLALTQSEYGFIGEVLTTAEGELYLKAHAITNIAWNAETRALYEQRAPNLEFFNLKTLFGEVMTTGQPVIANDPLNDPRRGGLPSGHPHMGAFLGLPFHHGERLIGMVGIANRPGGYNQTDVDSLQPFLAMCANMIEALRNDMRRKQAEAAVLAANTELEEALHRLKSAAERMAEQERLRALGTMVSGIAHDFNNSLSPILGFSEILLMDDKYLEDKERVRRYARMIHLAATDAASVVRRMQEFYRPSDSGKRFVAVRVDALIEQVLGLTQLKWKDQALAAGGTVRIVTEIGEVPAIAGNEHELREVLTNLIFNAVDAMPQGGTITIRTMRDEGLGMRDETATASESSALISHPSSVIPHPSSLIPHPSSLIPHPSAIILEVSDTGVGMDDEQRKQCLEPFYTTKGAQGTGLGLSVTYSIIERHQGELEIDSEPGRGTTVRLRLPAFRGESAAEGQAPGAKLRSLRVLLIDDEALVREATQALLSADGHTVDTASDGASALQLFHANQYDLVILDRAMPEVNGDQLAEFIAQHRPGTPVIMLTGFGEMMKHAGECPPGVTTVVGKPVTAAALRKALAEATRRD